MLCRRNTCCKNNQKSLTPVSNFTTVAARTMVLFRALPASIRVASFLAVLAWLGACAVTPDQPVEQVVKARAQQRWDAVLRQDLDVAYGFLSPGTRAVTPQKGYRDSFRAGFFKSATVESVKCGSPDSCEAQVAIEYGFRGSQIKTPLAETWIKQDGNWWLVLK